MSKPKPKAKPTIGRDAFSFVTVWLAVAEGRLPADVALAYMRPEGWEKRK